MTLNISISRTRSRYHCFLMSYHRANLLTRQTRRINSTTWFFDTISCANCTSIVSNNLVNSSISTCCFRNLSTLTSYMTSNFRYSHIISRVNRTRLINRTTSSSNITSCWINITLNLNIRRTSSRNHRFLVSYHWINLFRCHASCINGLTWLFNPINCTNCLRVISNYLTNPRISILNSINSLFLCFFMTSNLINCPIISRVNRTRLSNRTTSTINNRNSIISMTFNSCISRTSSRHHCFLMSNHWINLITCQISGINCTTRLFNTTSCTNCTSIISNNFMNASISTSSFRNLSILT